MLKKGFSILFLLAFLLQVMYLPTLVFYLEYHKDRIAEELCVNKLEPELMCSGRCYISSVTAEALGGGDGEQSKVPAHEEQIPTTLIAHTYRSFDISTIIPFESKADQTYTNLYFYQMSSGIFHPPRG